MVADYHYKYTHTAKLFLAKLVTPLQYIAAWPYQIADNVIKQVVSYNTLKQENQRLTREHFLLKIQLQKLRELELENKQLRSIFKATLKNQNYQIVVAETLDIDSDIFSHEIVIDKGSQQGVYIGQTALDENGLIGQVIQTTPLSSRVLLISDTRSAVPVQNYRTGVRALAVGNGSQSNLSLANVPITADIRVGDTLLSSGLGNRYPAGLPVGVISSIQRNPKEQFATITVTPAALLNRNKLIVLIWPKNS